MLDGLLTTAERTGYAETTSYEDVVTFMRRLADAHESFHLTSFGVTHEGRPLPLIVVGSIPSADPDAVRKANRLVAWLQGNIHGGEVSGKEALLMLLRTLASDEPPEWADDMVLLVAPIYNADGNEAMAVDNRPRQHGPVGGMGTRYSAQDLDLNRDHTKLESPEARSLVAAYSAYDPDVIVDLHTTNGTQHGYHLTYAPPLHPNTAEPIDTLLRDAWLPAVTRETRAKDGWDFYYYGNVGPTDGGERGWRTFDHRPRFNNNYAGLRNRFGILSEAYAYATFEERVWASLRFVEEVLAFAAEHAALIRATVQQADRTSIVGTRVTLRALPLRSETPSSIVLGTTVTERHPVTGHVMLRRTDATRVETMPEYGRFAGTVSTVAPSAYYLPPALGDIAVELARHGIHLRNLETAIEIAVEEFVITASSTSDRMFEGHHERTLDGVWRPTQRRLPVGTAVVDLEQPLARLAIALIEPQSDDGLVNWNFLDDVLEETDTDAEASLYPIVREP